MSIILSVELQTKFLKFKKKLTEQCIIVRSKVNFLHFIQTEITKLFKKVLFHVFLILLFDIASSLITLLIYYFRFKFLFVLCHSFLRQKRRRKNNKNFKLVTHRLVENKNMPIKMLIFLKIHRKKAYQKLLVHLWPKLSNLWRLKFQMNLFTCWFGLLEEEEAKLKSDATKHFKYHFEN